MPGYASALIPIMFVALILGGNVYILSTVQSTRHATWILKDDSLHVLD